MAVFYINRFRTLRSADPSHAKIGAAADKKAESMLCSLQSIIKDMLQA
jgi:hypothetical protein